MHWIKRELTRGMLSVLGVAGLLLAAPHARAACGLSSIGQGSAIKLPMLGQAEAEAEGEWHGQTDSIVGLWHVVYTAGGATFNETLDQWHSDGTEFENAFWRRRWVTSASRLEADWFSLGETPPHRLDIRWHRDDTANGTFTLDEMNTVAKDAGPIAERLPSRPLPWKGCKVRM